jgi:GT2 family glycosyltransferase
VSRPVADVVIVTWNSRDDTLRAVEGALAQIGGGAGQVPGVRVTVVDNGSVDGTHDALIRFGPRVRCARLQTNRGFTGGIAAGVDLSDAEYAIFLNNDAVPEPGWLAAMIEGLATADDDVIASAGKIVDYDGVLVDFIEGVMTFDGHAFQRDFRRPLVEAHTPEPGSELLFACGGNMIVRREPYVRLGGFDDDYFAYLEDVDFGWRSWIAGWRTTFNPRAVVRHKSAATSNRLGAFERGVLFERNALQTVVKNFEKDVLLQMAGPIFLTLLHRMHRYVIDRNSNIDALRRPAFGQNGNGVAKRGLVDRILRKLGLKGLDPVLDDPLTVMQFRAMDWFFANQQRLMDKRAAVQKTRVRSDRDIFERFPLRVVPTYHGDADLFGSALFAALRHEIPTRTTTLEELMQR